MYVGCWYINFNYLGFELNMIFFIPRKESFQLSWNSMYVQIVHICPFFSPDIDLQ